MQMRTLRLSDDHSRVTDCRGPWRCWKPPCPHPRSFMGDPRPCASTAKGRRQAPPSRTSVSTGGAGAPQVSGNTEATCCPLSLTEAEATGYKQPGSMGAHLRGPQRLWTLAFCSFLCRATVLPSAPPRLAPGGPSEPRSSPLKRKVVKPHARTVPSIAPALRGDSVTWVFSPCRSSASLHPRPVTQQASSGEAPATPFRPLCPCLPRVGMSFPLGSFPAVLSSGAYNSK